MTADVLRHTNKKYYIQLMIREIRQSGGTQFWILNSHHFEIYHFDVSRISEFDIQCTINNSLMREHIFTGTFVMHMQSHILTLLEEVPGTIYTSKLECYRELYTLLNVRHTKIPDTILRDELTERIEYIECQFPQLIL